MPQLTDQLAELRSTCAAAHATLEHDLRDNEAQRVMVLADIDRLRQQLTALTEHEQSVREALVARTYECQIQERDAAVAALQASYESLRAFQDMQDRATRLDQHIEELHQANPDLDHLLEGYQQLSTNKEHLLASLPVAVQSAVAQTLEDEEGRLRTAIAPLLDLQAQRAVIKVDDPATFQVLVARQSADDLITWALPFPAGSSLPPFITSLLVSAESALATAGTSPDWTIDDLDTGNWEGFSVVLALARYDGALPLADATRAILANALSRLEGQGEIALDVRVDELPYDVWQQGRQNHQLEEDSLSTPGAESEQPLIERSQGWFSDDDIRLWSRREGKVSSQGRRMRTLLMRMLGRGIIGETAISMETLWEALPAGHDTQMRQGILDLMEAGVLQRATMADEGAVMVTINPAMLGEVQTLIRRETSGVWAGIVG